MTALCVGRDPEWWDTDNAGARLAMAICRACPLRLDCYDDSPAGVIRAGVPYSNVGTALKTCPTCGYPQPGELTNHKDRCPHCDVPSLARWRTDIERWHAAGISDREAGARVGATREQIKAARRPRGQRLQLVSAPYATTPIERIAA